MINYALQSIMQSNSQIQSPGNLSLEIVPNRLAWIIADKAPQEKRPLICFNTQRLNHKTKEGLSITDLKQFLQFASELMQRHQKLIYYTKNEENSVLIGSVIVSLYKLIQSKKDKHQVQKFVKSLGIALGEFGQPGFVTYGVETVINCISIVKNYGFFNSQLQLESEIKMKQGTIFRMIPNKIFVFEYNKPHVETKEQEKSKNLIEFTHKFKQLSITKAIGFQGQYDFPYSPNQFSLNGILYQMITVFNSQEPEIIAIEKAISAIKPEDVYAINSQDEFGLSLFFVAAYSIKVLKFSLQEAVCWCRMMVPNCIKQSQLLWLKKKYKALAGTDTYVTAEQALKQIKKNGVVLTTDSYT